MKASDSQRKGDLAEIEVQKTVLLFGSKWLPAPGGYAAIDGLIDLYKHQEQTGLLIAVQVKAGPSYVKKRTRGSLVVGLRAEQLKTLRRLRMPTVLVFWDEQRRRLFWGEIGVRGKATTVTLSTGRVFGRHSFGDLYKLARRFGGYSGDLPVVRFADRPSTSEVRGAKQAAWRFYNSWRKDGCRSPAFGGVAITRKGWRHLTERWRSKNDLIHRLALLPVARLILERHDRYRLLRTVSAGQQLYGQTAVVRMAYRNDAIVTVVVERSAEGLHRFYGVFEERRRQGGTEVLGGCLGATAAE